MIANLRSRLPLLLLAIAALAIGVLARFWGLGSIPFAVDEYYLSQSIANTIKHGLPVYDCGGYYLRGVVIQYLAAALQLSGMSAELAPRMIAAVSSVVALPAAWLLARRVYGPLVALLTVVVLALSVWEIEMARFGRMYAPFQAVFLWYVWYWLRYVIDRDSRALVPLVLLSTLGPLVWEGGVFLLLANLVPLFLWLPQPESAGSIRKGYMSRADWGFLLLSVVLLVLAYLFVTVDFRTTPEDFPAEFGLKESVPPPDPVALLSAPYLRLFKSSALLLLAIVPIGFAAWGLSGIWRLRDRPLPALGLALALAVAVVHQFLLAGALIVLLLLLRYLSWREIFVPPVRQLLIALAALVVFWTAVGVLCTDWSDAPVNGNIARGVAMLGYQFFKLPDIVFVVVRPWARAIPFLGAGLFLLTGLALLRLLRSEDRLTSERALLALFVILMLASSLSNPPRQETRYIFELYPLLIIFAIGMLSRIASAVTPARLAGLATVALSLGGFALSEDFMPRHLRHISAPAQAFRIGMNVDMESHLVMRGDSRVVADWLRQNIPAQAVVINGVHGLDHYYREMDYFYVGLQDPNFSGWACRRGTVDRWSNTPMLYTPAALARAIEKDGIGYLVAFDYDRPALLQDLAAFQPKVRFVDDGLVILELRD